MSEKKPRNLVPPEEILGWLEDNFPELWEVAEEDRAWVWLPVDLRDQSPQVCEGKTNEEVRRAIGKDGFGFKFARRGHALESGATGTWAHCGVVPIPFKRRSGSKAAPRERKDGKTTPAGGGEANLALPEDLMAEIAAALEEAAA